MISIKQFSRITITLLILVLFLSNLNEGLAQEKEVSQEIEKIKILVSILPYSYLVEQIGQDKVEVIVMVPPRANPHTYEPPPAQLKMISQIQLYVLVGSQIDFEVTWAEKIKKLNPKMQWCDSSVGVPLIENNPHIWLSLRNSQGIIQNITQALIQIDPDNEDFYRQNADRFRKKLIQLDEQLTIQLSSLEKRKFLTYHPSWVYLARDYQLEQLAIEQEGKEPQSAALIKIIKEAKRYQLSFILCAPQFNLKSAQVIAQEIGAQIVYVDPLAWDYLENIQWVADILAGKVL